MQEQFNVYISTSEILLTVRENYFPLLKKLNIAAMEAFSPWNIDTSFLSSLVTPAEELCVAQECRLTDSKVWKLLNVWSGIMEDP